jgi:hypothetical protein
MNRGDVVHQLEVLRGACVAVRGEGYCTDRVVQGIAAIARHETGFSSLKPFHKPATAAAPEWWSYNYGAQQCGTVAHNGVCPDGCFPATDTSPTSTGVNIPYLACFLVNPSEQAGAESLVRLLTVRMRGVASALPSGDCQVVAQAMRDVRYFEGFGKTQAERVRGYAEALCRNAVSNAKESHEALVLVLPPPPAPPPPSDLSILGGLVLSGLGFLTRAYRARAATVDALDAADPDAGADLSDLDDIPPPGPNS